MASYVILCNISPVGADAAVRDGFSPADQIADAIAQANAASQLRVWWTKGSFALVALVEGVNDAELHSALLALAGRGTLQTTTLPAIETSGIDDILVAARTIDGHIRGGH